MKRKGGKGHVQNEKGSGVKSCSTQKAMLLISELFSVQLSSELNYLGPTTDKKNKHKLSYSCDIKLFFTGQGLFRMLAG